MGIMINLDVMMAKRKMSLNELSEKVGITLANLSILKNNKAKAIRFSTLDAICKALECNVEDIIKVSEALLRPSGKLFMVHRPERLVDMFCLMRIVRLMIETLANKYIFIY